MSSEQQTDTPSPYVLPGKPKLYTGGGGGSGGLDSTEGKRKYVSYETPLGSSPGMTTCTSLCVLACGCFLIPLFVKHFKDAYHTCPRCNRILHVEKKKCCK
uniref:LITAF domain-containing protein n=1 Tax=Sparus aurata TaxID=8175 RepID=A0A671XAR4_SPAAU